MTRNSKAVLRFIYRTLTSAAMIGLVYIVATRGFGLSESPDPVYEVLIYFLVFVSIVTKLFLDSLIRKEKRQSG